MRNLVRLRRAAWHLPSLSSAEGSEAEALCFCVNASEQLVYLLHEKSGRIDALPIDDPDAEPELLVELNTAVLTPDDARWRWVDYVAELDALVCGSTGGTLVMVDLQTREPEEIGALDGGLVGMAWSSNQEALALATGVGTLLVMNTQWEVLHETHLLPTGSTSVPSASVSISWRDDGQFLGINVATMDGTKTVRKVFVFTQLLELHATGRLEDGRAIPHLGETVDWCPNHSLIASHETRKEQLFVVFFERNGLRHGEFPLPVEYHASTTLVKKIRWNIQSDILAVHLESASDGSRLLLWTRNNYHWYLKQEFRFEVGEDRDALRDFEWDGERATLLHLVVASSFSNSVRYEQCELAWDVNRGERRLQNGQLSVVVAVIDGPRLLLTPIHQALVPPPMALHSLTYAAPVNSVVFDASTDALAVALSTGEVILETNFLAAENSTSVRDSQRVQFDSNVNSLLFMRREARSSTTTLAVKAKQDDSLIVLSIETNNTRRVNLSEEVAGVCRTSEIVSVDPGVVTTTIEFALQAQSGRVVRVRVEDDDAVVREITLPTVLPLLGGFEVLQMEDDRYTVIGVTLASSKLLVDGVLATTAACSSFKFCAYSSVLLYTTLGSAAQLRFVPLSSLATRTFDQNDEHRVIERGSRLVGVVGDRASVVLQMPRGNLEGTSPRLLVLALVTRQIQKLNFVQALEMGRRHRIDLNVLVDHNPGNFLAHFREHLVDALLSLRPATVTSDRLCLFLTNLHVVDVWSTKYGPQLKDLVSPAQDSEQSLTLTGQQKVNKVCQEMMTVLHESEENHVDALLLPFLTAAVKQSPQDYRSALTRLQSLIGTSLPEDATRAKRAMKHLIFLSNVDTLFDEALGMYDLPLVRFIAAYSQRDPKEYLPLLDACEAEQDVVMRKLKIDKHLHRHEKALDHIAELLDRIDLGEEMELQFERDAVELVVRGGLYNNALAHFSPSHPRPVVTRLHRNVLQLKAQFLVNQGEFEDAGYIYLSTGGYVEAMHAFKSARAWQMALATASKAKLDPATDLRAFARELVEAILSQKEVSADDAVTASHIYADYCGDVDEAVALLVSHKQWSEGIRLAYLHNRPDLVETDVETGVAVAYDALCEDIAQRQHEYVGYWKRLSTIREQKRLFKLHGIDGSRWEGGPSDDSQSVVSAASAADSALSAASSLGSVGSHNSVARGIGNFAAKTLAAATSSHFYATQSLGGAASAAATAAAYKSKRYGGMPSRAERRRRIKEGSEEEEAHVAKQLRMSAPSEALQRETRDVLRALVFLGHAAKAETLQRQLSALEATVRDEFPMLTMPGEALEEAREPWRFPSFKP